MSQNHCPRDVVQLANTNGLSYVLFLFVLDRKGKREREKGANDEENSEKRQKNGKREDKEIENRKQEGKERNVENGEGGE